MNKRSSMGARRIQQPAEVITAGLPRERAMTQARIANERREPARPPAGETMAETAARTADETGRAAGEARVRLRDWFLLSRPA
jgi:hypothetical protein